MPGLGVSSPFKSVIKRTEEYEVVPIEQCGGVAWVMEDDGTFTKTKIY